MSLEPWMPCRDMQASIEFYTGILDFEIWVAPNPDPSSFDSRHAILQRDGHVLHLDSHARERGAFGTAIYIRVRNIDELFERFVQRGLEFDSPLYGDGPFDQSWGMREFGFRDPDGNVITYGQEIA